MKTSECGLLILHNLAIEGVQLCPEVIVLAARWFFPGFPV